MPMRYEPEHYEFEFYYLPKNGILHKEVTNYCSWVSNNFASICKGGMTSIINSEWILRTYNATKMVMASTLLLNSAKYCIEHGLLITVPYLLYYSAFNACRSLVYVTSFSESNSLDNLIEITHSKVLNIIPDIVARLNKLLSDIIKKQLYELKDERELYSYVFPANGLRNELEFDRTVNLCGILVELAELTGRRIQNYIEKKFLYNESLRNIATESWQMLNQNIISKIFAHKTKSINDQEVISWIDEEDWSRVDYIKRKVKYPCSIFLTMTEGMTEDFFGAWCIEDTDTGDFNSLKNWNIIFPIP